MLATRSGRREPLAASQAAPRAAGLATRFQGFTLIEVLVVMVVVAVILAMIGLRVGGDEHRAVREEAERLALLMQSAQQEAILQGTVLGLTVAEQDYHFLRLVIDQETRKPRFEQIEGDDVLRPRLLPAAMSVRSVLLDGAPAGTDPIVFTHTGELMQAVTITFAQGEARWRVEGGLDGRIVAVAPNG